MRKAIITAALVLGLVALAPTAAVGNANGTERPFMFKGEGINTVNLAATPPLVVNDYVLTVTHLGKATGHIEGVITPGAFPPCLEPAATFCFTSTVGTLVAANGDTLSAYCWGPSTIVPGSVPTRGYGTRYCTFTDGTGRFEDAEGEFTDSIETVNIDVGQPAPGWVRNHIEHQSLEGWISY